MYDYLRAAYRSMQQRCYNPRAYAYKWYGAKGVTMSQIWLDSYEQFAQDVGERPDSSYSIDRIDRTKPYEPGNVRWATRRQQILNRCMQVSNTSGYRGVHRDGTRWRAEIRSNGVKYKLGSYATKIEAARAYDRGALKYHGEEAQLNFTQTTLF